MADDSLSGRACGKAAGRGGNRAWSAFVTVLFLLPLAAVLVQYWTVRSDASAAEREAVRELASPSPGPAAWGVLGGLRLRQGRIAEALPLLRKASDLEFASGDDARDTLALAQAEIQGASAGIAGADRAAAEAALLRVQALAPRLPPAPGAAAWCGAGLLWRDLGFRAREVDDFRKAVLAQQAADGAGTRYQPSGLESYYQQMLAGALEP